MNSLMYDGKKSAAEGIIYGAFDTIQQKTKTDPIQVFHEALRNVAPAIEVKSRRVGGATYQVPVEVRTDRARALAIRWLITAARGRNEPTMTGRLSGELMDAANNRGHRRQEARRHPQDGGRQSRVLPLPLVKKQRVSHGPRHPARKIPQYRHCRAYRRRQDDHDRAHPLLHRQEP